jgi:AraC family transcriptional regulator of arabinose operon
MRGKNHRIEAALQEVARGHAQRLTEDALAARLGLSRSRFAHLFREQTRSSFRRRLREIELTKAKVLLGDPGLRVKEIASKCGYATTSDLTRAFKKKFGLPPSQYRASTSG